MVVRFRKYAVTSVLSLRALFPLTIFLLFASVSLAQNTLPADYVRMETLTIDNGLSQNYVPAIIQDKEGYLWFATKDGLNKYDGYTFTVYRLDPDDPASLSDNSINCVFEDSKGRLWVGTVSKGLELFDREKETFIHFPALPEKNGNSNHISNIQQIVEDPAGGIWLLGQNQWGQGERFTITERKQVAHEKEPSARGKYNLNFVPAKKYFEDSFHIMLHSDTLAFYSVKGGVFGILGSDSLYLFNKNGWMKRTVARMSMNEMIKPENDKIIPGNPKSILIIDPYHNRNYIISYGGSVYELDYLQKRLNYCGKTLPKLILEYYMAFQTKRAGSGCLLSIGSTGMILQIILWR